MTRLLSVWSIVVVLRLLDKSGVIRDNLSSMWIPAGWSWGGLVSDHCPIWLEFDLTWLSKLRILCLNFVFSLAVSLPYCSFCKAIFCFNISQSPSSTLLFSVEQQWSRIQFSLDWFASMAQQIPVSDQFIHNRWFSWETRISRFSTRSRKPRRWRSGWMDFLFRVRRSIR